MPTLHYTLLGRSGSIALIQTENRYICTLRKQGTRWFRDVVLLGIQDEKLQVFPKTEWRVKPGSVDKMTIDLSSSWIQDIVLKDDELAFQLPGENDGFAIMVYRFIAGSWRATGIRYQHGIASKIREDLSFIYCLTDTGELDIHMRLEDPLLLENTNMAILYEPFEQLQCMEEPGTIARAVVDAEEDRIVVVFETTTGKKRHLLLKRNMH